MESFWKILCSIYIYNKYCWDKILHGIINGCFRDNVHLLFQIRSSYSGRGTRSPWVASKLCCSVFYEISRSLEGDFFSFLPFFFTLGFKWNLTGECNCAFYMLFREYAFEYILISSVPIKSYNIQRGCAFLIMAFLAEEERVSFVSFKSYNFIPFSENSFVA